MLPMTSLSITANVLRTYLGGNIVDLDGVFIGHPKEAEEQIGGEGKQYLNLFFYQVEYGGYPVDGGHEDPFYISINCLVTPFGSKETGPPETSVSAGENDLRMVGEVLDLFHRQPVVTVSEGDENAQLQILFLPLSLNEINHIWSTQGDVPYRLSVAYQLSLVPVPLAEAQQRAPFVSALGLDVRSDLEQAPMPAEGFGIEVRDETMPELAVDGARPDWAPKIAFLDAQGKMRHSLTFVAGAVPASLNTLLAGPAGEALEMIWEQWDLGTQPAQWETVGSPLAAVAAAPSIDPEQTDPSLASLAAAVPFPVSSAGQALLYARRSWTRPDGVTVRLHSNPLLVIIEEAP